MKLTLNEINTITTLLIPFFSLMIIIALTLFVKPFIRTIKEIF